MEPLFLSLLNCRKGGKGTRRERRRERKKHGNLPPGMPERAICQRSPPGTGALLALARNKRREASWELHERFVWNAVRAVCVPSEVWEELSQTPRQAPLPACTGICEHRSRRLPAQRPLLPVMTRCRHAPLPGNFLPWRNDRLRC